MGAPAAPSIFDAAYVRWLSQLKDGVHKLAMSGLRRPSGEGLPAANGASTAQPQDDQNALAALQRWASPCTFHTRHVLESCNGYTHYQAGVGRQGGIVHNS